VQNRSVPLCVPTRKASNSETPKVTVAATAYRVVATFLIFGNAEMRTEAALFFLIRDLSIYRLLFLIYAIHNFPAIGFILAGHLTAIDFRAFSENERENDIMDEIILTSYSERLIRFMHQD